MALPFVGCRQRVAPRDEDIAARTLEYMTAMETALQPEASGLEGDYRILADFNGTVLAGTHSKHGIQFVTWDRDYDRTDEALRWRNTGAAEKWDRKRQSFRRNPFLASQKSTYFCKKDKKVSDTGREGGGEDRVSR